jgi:hypothetical protein
LPIVYCQLPFGSDVQRVTCAFLPIVYCQLPFDL